MPPKKKIYLFNSGRKLQLVSEKNGNKKKTKILKPRCRLTDFVRPLPLLLSDEIWIKKILKSWGANPLNPSTPYVIKTILFIVPFTFVYVTAFITFL